ncbi:24952_t:CDS:1, partial [Racocetra persica]
EVLEYRDLESYRPKSYRLKSHRLRSQLELWICVRAWLKLQA